MRAHYHKDPLFMKVLHHPEAYLCFRIKDRLIWTKNRMGRDIVCIPQKAFIWGRWLIKVILDQAHTTIGHFGQLSTSRYVRRFYWWPSMGADIELFCSSCALCQTTKDSMQKPAGLLHSLPIPDQPWQSVRLDFMGPLPKSKGYDYLLVIIDRFTSQVHLLFYMCDSKSSRVVIFHGDRKTPWNAGVDRIQSRPKIHFQVLEGAAPTHGDETPHVNFIPSTNAWSDGTGQPFHQPSVAGTSPQQPKQLGRALPNGRVCAQQQCECEHGLRTLRTQLRVYPAVGTTP